ncbi:hypothetical protein F3K02_16980 [Hydrogenophaga sp. D2P1]|uniref:Uncharacterized protein n=1 Tax=Hydrogenophaga aromaticivorans TaxID=2610898 RepID=A0A7Y8KZ95_9BURK|nr:hypothetical protein [Hydrogenophaga aromaticivorans]NWF46933.1 hypothetical protein [Hydrogenophaga aromaticivorans]
MNTFTEHPPVPKVLQEALKDYPDLIARLEEGLTAVGLRPGMSRAQRTDQLERAFWRLEGDMDSFVEHASDEVAAADAAGDADRTAHARRKLHLLQLHRRDGGEELMKFFAWGQD